MGGTGSSLRALGTTWSGLQTSRRKPEEAGRLFRERPHLTCAQALGLAHTAWQEDSLASELHCRVRGRACLCGGVAAARCRQALRMSCCVGGHALTGVALVVSLTGLFSQKVGGKKTLKEENARPACLCPERPRASEGTGKGWPWVCSPCAPLRGAPTAAGLVPLQRQAEGSGHSHRPTPHGSMTSHSPRSPQQPCPRTLWRQEAKSGTCGHTHVHGRGDHHGQWALQAASVCQGHKDQRD